MVGNLLVRLLSRTKQRLTIVALCLACGLIVFFNSNVSYAEQTDNFIEVKKFAEKCDDFLSIITQPPEGIEFIQCIKDDEGQTKPFIAEYRFSGKIAGNVEQFFMQTFGFAPLTYTCCGWEPPKSYYHYEDQLTGILYSIGIGVETIYSNRDDWHKIPYFTLTISSDTLAP